MYYLPRHLKKLANAAQAAIVTSPQIEEALMANVWNGPVRPSAMKAKQPAFKVAAARPAKPAAKKAAPRRQVKRGR